MMSNNHDKNIKNFYKYSKQHKNKTHLKQTNLKRNFQHLKQTILKIIKEIAENAWGNMDKFVLPYSYSISVTLTISKRYTLVVLKNLLKRDFITMLTSLGWKALEVSPNLRIVFGGLGRHMAEIHA